MRARRLRWLRVLLLAVLTVVAIAVAATWTLARIWGPSLTREHLEAFLSEVLGQPVRVGGIRIHAWRTRVSLVDVDVPPRPEPGGLVLRASAVDASIDLASLWRRRLTISLVANGLHFEMTLPRTTGGGRSPFPLRDHVQVGPLEIGVGSVRIKDARVVIREPEGAFALDVAGADVTARPAAGDLEVSGQLGALGLDVLGRQLRVDRVVLDGRLSADEVRIRRLAWRWDGEDARVEGQLRHPWVADRELSLRGQGDLAAATIARVARLDSRLDGKLHVDAEITGPAGSPRIAARIGSAELDLAGVTARDVAIAGQWNDRELRLDEVKARIAGARVDGRLDATPIPGGGARVAVELREIVLPEALARLGSGTATAEGRLREGGIDLVKTVATWRGLETSLDGRIAFAGPLALRGNAVADLAEVGRSLGWGDLSGRATIAADLTGRGASPTIEGRARITGLVAAGRSADTVDSSFRLARGSPDSRWAGQVRVQPLRWDRVAIDGVDASLTADGRRLELTSARARIATVPVEASGTWEWTGSGQGRATLGPAPLGSITGVPAALRLGGRGQATIEASFQRGGVSATGAARLDQVSAVGVSLGAGQMDVRLRGSALDAEIAFPARQLRATVTGALAAGGTLDGRLQMDDLGLRPLLQELGSGAAEHVDGRLSLRADASLPLGQPSSVRGTARIAPEGLRLGGESWTSREPVLLRWENSRLAVERLRLDSAAGTLVATGALVSPGDEALDLTLDNARLPGAPDKLGRGTIRSQVRFRDQGLEVSRLDARWPWMTATASGRARADGAIDATARADVDLAPLGPLLGVAGLGGRATLTADARQRGDALEGAGALRSPRIELHGAALSGVDLPFRLAASSLRVERAQATVGASRISGDATMTWARGAPITADALRRTAQISAQVSAPAARLEDLDAFVPTSMRGRGQLAVTARAGGTLEAWRGSGTIGAPSLELGAGTLRDLRATLAADQTRVEVTELRVDGMGIPVRAAGSWSWSGGGTAKATLGPARLDEVTLVPGSAGLRGTGRASIEASVRSTADVSGTAHVALDDVVVGGAALGRGLVDVTARDGIVRAEATFPSQALRAVASGRIDAGGTLTAEASAPGIDLARVAEALWPKSGTIGGTLSARATVRVPVAEPGRGEGLLTIDPVRVVVAKEVWENRGAVEVRWARGGLSLSPFRLASRSGAVSGAGTVGSDGKLDARAAAQVSLAAFSAIRPEVQELAGALDVSLRASGTLTAPTFLGDGAIHGGQLLWRDRPEAIRDVEARLIFSSQGVRLSEATASIGGGRVRAQGDLALSGWQPGAYRVRVQARNVAIGPIEGFASAWDADLDLSGLTQEAQLEGRVRLVRGLYNREVSIVGLALAPSRAAAAETGPLLRLRVRVDLDDNLVVRNRIADLRAGGSLSVEGTTDRPVVFGALESRDGRVNFRGRDWSVASATVRFADPRRIDPYIDVLATSRIAEYDVTMHVTGPSSNIAVRFSSTPRLAQNDLLSLVAFGVTGADLRESPATVLLGEAGKLVARNVLGVDPGSTGLRVTTGSPAGSAGEIHGFPGEERTTPGRGQNTVGAKERVRVEYQLISPLYLSGEYDREGGYGADVVLRFRFR